MSFNRAWQAQERLVASWWGTFRNPLSGRNNRNDDGSKRLGDIMYKPALIEVKRHNDVSMKIAESVRALARAHYKRWALFEFRTGCANLVKITVDHDTAEAICGFLREKWDKEEKNNGVE